MASSFASRPRALDPRTPARLHGVADRSPLPILAIELIRPDAFQQQSVFRRRARRAKCFFPTLPWRALGRNDETLVFHAQFHLFAEATLLDDRFGNADSAGISDAHQFSPHNPWPPGNYIVITYVQVVQ